MILGRSSDSREEWLEQALQLLDVCNNNHNGKLVIGCPICTFRAANVVHRPKEVDVAEAFLAKLDKEKIRSDITLLREAWGESAPKWMFKPEYV